MHSFCNIFDFQVNYMFLLGGFTLKRKSQSIAYLLNESEQIYWILDLEGEVHSIWDLRISSLQEYKGNGYFKVGRAAALPSLKNPLGGGGYVSL
jgi:hypothetical protein